MRKIDKSSWPKGPWHDEPDTLEGEHAGFRTLILRTSLGHLCGYIGVAPDHWLHGQSYDTFYSFDVHGGLTFANFIPDFPDVWWFGFDCAHWGDYTPSRNTNPYEDSQYRDLEYVKSEVESLADQFAHLEQPPGDTNLIALLREVIAEAGYSLDGSLKYRIQQVIKHSENSDAN